ncbi:hypothetical protein [Paenibacillus sp. QZ-Y1]|uniref:hypothetical protein n=1 Tax=Paenibacillus sp. QZ-Y1 TaxID=3414511 RepID=UPI003F78D4F8
MEKHEISVYEISKLTKGQGVRKGLLTVLSYGNNDFEVITEWGTSLWQGDADSTVAFVHGFNISGEIKEKEESKVRKVTIEEVEELNDGEYLEMGKFFVSREYVQTEIQGTPARLYIDNRYMIVDPFGCNPSPSPDVETVVGILNGLNGFVD